MWLALRARESARQGFRSCVRKQMKKLHFTRTPEGKGAGAGCEHHSRTAPESARLPGTGQHGNMSPGPLGQPHLLLSRAGALRAHGPALPAPHVCPGAWQKAPWEQPVPKVRGLRRVACDRQQVSERCTAGPGLLRGAMARHSGHWWTSSNR